MDDRAFIAAALDFSNAGPDQFHPGFEQYRDLALAASRLVLTPAPAAEDGWREAVEAAAKVAFAWGVKNANYTVQPANAGSAIALAIRWLKFSYPTPTTDEAAEGEGK